MPFHLAFLLLEQHHPLDQKAIIAALKRRGMTATPATKQKREKSDGEPVLSLELGEEETLLLAPVPMLVPNDEAEEAAKLSISSMGTGWTLGEHRAHLIVTVQDGSERNALERLQRFTKAVAALIEAVPGVVGVYWGNAGATHDPGYFVAVVDSEEVTLLMSIANGISRALEGERLNLLSLGMKQLSLPDLLLTTPRGQADEAMEFFFTMLAYTAERGAPIKEGETIGRTAEEKYKIRYQPSPIDKSEKVWRVDLPPLRTKRRS